MTQSPKIQNAKPKRKEKLSDKEQSERFKEAAREIVSEDSNIAFEHLVQNLAKIRVRD